MDSPGSADVFQFGDFRFHQREQCLYRRGPAGEWQLVSISSRALRALAVLLERNGELVLKDEIMALVWSGRAVEESNLTVQISVLRRVLDDGRQGASCVQTVPGKGYRWVNAVTRVADVPSDPIVPPPSRARPGRRNLRWTAAVLGGIAVTLVAVLLIWRMGLAGNSGPPRLSVVVLPFRNLSDDHAEDYLADAITDDLTQVPGMLVIARETAFTYRDKPIDARRIGEEFGVRYVLEGSVRRAGDDLRVNAQLIASESGAHVWADRFDEHVRDLNAGQEEIVRRISQMLNYALWNVESIRSERERPTKPDAFDLIIRARSLRNGPHGQKQNERALTYYERALELDPGSVQAELGIARLLIDRNIDSLGQWSAADDMDRATRLIAAAATVRPEAEEILVATAELQQARAQWADVAFTAQRIIDLYPNRTEGYELLGMAKRFVASVEESVVFYEKSIRLNPLDPNMFRRCSCLAYALLLA
jgi:TolB-like protein/DNA-binding winged helix-turn-helix (wHTH) protein